MIVADNTAFQNEEEGILVISTTDGASTITGNTAAFNGSYGIFTGEGATVSGNAVHFNGGWGLNLGSAAGYAGNVVRGNTMGQVTGGVEIGTNLCGSNTTCP